MRRLDVVCRQCGFPRGNHKAVTENCPVKYMGTLTPIFSSVYRFVPAPTSEAAKRIARAKKFLLEHFADEEVDVDALTAVGDLINEVTKIAKAVGMEEASANIGRILEDELAGRLPHPVPSTVLRDSAEGAVLRIKNALLKVKP